VNQRPHTAKVGTLLYEVHATVDAELVASYEDYMIGTHIPDVLASRCFTAASLLKLGDSRYRIAYEVRDDATLQRYLDDHAPALRADFARHFPTGVELSREVWRVASSWSADI
jgi:hypothetical protein